MRAGRNRWAAQYQAPTFTTTPGGQSLAAYTNAGAPFYCEVRSPTGREALNAAQLKATVSHVVTCRYAAASPSPKGRLLVSADGFVTKRVFNVTSALDDSGRRREWTLYCTEQITP